MDTHQPMSGMQATHPRNHHKTCHKGRHLPLSNTDSSLLGSVDSREGLHISMHQPNPTFKNMAQPSKRDREYSLSAKRRCAHGNRSSKITKKRRHERRKRSRLAAEMKGEKLCNDMDVTFTEVNDSSTYPVPPTASPILPTITPSTPGSAQSSLPWPSIDFSHIGVQDFPQFGGRWYSPSRCLPWSFDQIPIFDLNPSWQLPSSPLGGCKTSSQRFVEFTDLSNGTRSTGGKDSKTGCHELQLWKGGWESRSQNPPRFSQVLPPRKSKSRSSALGCRLHWTDETAGNDASTIPSHNMSFESGTVVQSIEDDMGTKAKTMHDESCTANAANLWQILSDVTNGDCDLQSTLLSRSYTPPIPQEFVSHLSSFHEEALPAELDCNEIPYVHANSFTGPSNDPADCPITIDTEDSPAMDSAVYLYLQLNDGDLDPANIRPPMTPRSSTPIIDDGIPTEDVSFNGAVDVSEDGHDGDLLASSVHFVNEEELCDVSTSAISTLSESLDDLGAFQRVGHDEPCECGECDESPELIDAETVNGCDGWLLYSTSADELTSVS